MPTAKNRTRTHASSQEDWFRPYASAEDWFEAMDPPIADGAELLGYDFQNYKVKLTSKGKNIGYLKISRDQAVKLALTILGLQMLPSPGLTREEADSIKWMADHVAADAEWMAEYTAGRNKVGVKRRPSKADAVESVAAT